MSGKLLAKLSQSKFVIKNYYKFRSERSSRLTEVVMRLVLESCKE